MEMVMIILDYHICTYIHLYNKLTNLPHPFPLPFLHRTTSIVERYTKKNANRAFIIVSSSSRSR